MIEACEVFDGFELRLNDETVVDVDKAHSATHLHSCQMLGEGRRDSVV